MEINQNEVHVAILNNILQIVTCLNWRLFSTVNSLLCVEIAGMFITIHSQATTVAM